MATVDSSLPMCAYCSSFREIEAISSPLTQGRLCDLLWSTECSGSAVLIALSPDLKCTGNFLFLLIGSHLPCKKSNYPEITMLWRSPSYSYVEAIWKETERERCQPASYFSYPSWRHQTWEWRSFLGYSNPNRYSMNRRTTQLSSAQITELWEIGKI